MKRSHCSSSCSPPPPENDLDSISFASNHSDDASGYPINEDVTVPEHEWNHTEVNVSILGPTRSPASTQIEGIMCPPSSTPVPSLIEGQIFREEEESSRVVDGTLPVHGEHEVNHDDVSEDSGDDIADFFAAMIEMTRPPDSRGLI